MFSSEFCEISKNNFFHRTPLVAPSEGPWKHMRKMKEYRVKLSLNLLALKISNEFHVLCERVEISKSKLISQMWRHRKM